MAVIVDDIRLNIQANLQELERIINGIKQMNVSSKELTATLRTQAAQHKANLQAIESEEKRLETARDGRAKRRRLQNERFCRSASSGFGGAAAAAKAAS